MSNKKIREMVSDAYTKAIKQSGGCCGSTPAGSVAKLAGYGTELKEHADAGLVRQIEADRSFPAITARKHRTHSPLRERREPTHRVAEP